MPIPWERVVFGGDQPWLGLYDRRLTLVENPRYAQQAYNVELLGAALAKRAGTRLANGVVGTVSSVLGAVLTVPDTTGINDTDTIKVWSDPDMSALPSVATRTVSSHTGTTITLSSALPFTPIAGSAWLVKHALAGGARVNGLFQANFRDGTQVLLAQAATGIYDVLAGAGNANPALITERYPATTVDVTWVSLTTGTLTSVQGLQVGDWIRIAGAGLAGSILQTRVTVLTPSTRTITIDPPANVFPASGAAVTFMPIRQAGADAHFAQYANVTSIAEAQPLTNPPIGGTPNPPTKYARTIAAGVGIYRHGIKPPVTEPTILSLSAGPGPTGAYRYRLKFRCSRTGQESEPSPESGTFNPVNQTVNLQTLAVSVDPQVDKKRLYRTTDGGAGLWFFLAEVTNATTTYSDTTTDAALSTTRMREFLDNVISDTASVIAPWTQANRLVAIDGITSRYDPDTRVETLFGGFLRYSDQPDAASGFLKGESWPVDNTIFVGYDDGDVLTGVVPFFDALLVFKERSIWRVTGIPPNLTIEPVVFRQDQTGVGAFNQKSVVVGENEMMLPFQDGAYLVDRYAGVQTGLQSRLISREIDERFQQIDAATQGVSHGVYFRQRRQLRLWLPRTPLSGDVTTEKLGQSLFYQLNATDQGEPVGWTETAYYRDLGAGTQLIDPTASCVARTSGQDVTYIGGGDGLVTQLDDETNQVGDWGFLPVEAFWTSIPFSPAGQGVPARARAVDFVTAGVRPIPHELLPVPLLFVTGDFQARDAQVQILVDGATPSPSSFGVERRYTVLTRGTKLSLNVDHTGALCGWRIQQMRLWFQRLPIAAMPVAGTQVDPIAY